LAHSSSARWSERQSCLSEARHRYLAARPANIAIFFEAAGARFRGLDAGSCRQPAKKSTVRSLSKKSTVASFSKKATLASLSMFHAEPVHRAGAPW